MLDALAKTIAETQLLHPENLYVVGVSGGVDSMVLFHCLANMKVRMICAHFDHGLRAASSGDKVVVERAAQALGVPFVHGSGNVSKFQTANKTPVEAAARELRYRFLFKTARNHGASGVVTAHHADDQAETVLMHLLRGAGKTGLSGMAPASILPGFDPEIPLLRPFLAAWRSEILAYSQLFQVEYIEDETNSDTNFLRNRLRHELLPVLETYNPKIKETLVRTAKVFEIDEAVLDNIVETAWREVVISVTDKWVEIDLDGYLKQEKGIRNRLIRKALSVFPAISADFEFAVADRGSQLALSQNTTGSVDLIAGLRMFREYDRLWIAASEVDLPSDRWPQIGEEMVFLEAGDGHLSLDKDWVVTWKTANGDIEVPGNLSRFEVHLDIAALNAPLAIRRRRAGDRFKPLGMQGSVRISDAMINWKIPKRLRSGWPLLVSGDQVVWVAGYGMGESFAVKPDTGTILKVKLFRR